MEKRIIVLCGVQGCCPTVEIGKEEVVIKDDFGGQVKLTKSQWDDLLKKSSEAND